MWQLSILTDYNEVFSDDHLCRWKQHVEYAECSDIFSHPDMLYVWYESYRRIRTLTPCIVWANDDETGNVGLWPLVIWSRNIIGIFTHVVMVMGDSDMDYHEPIFTYRPTIGSRNSFVDLVCNYITRRTIYDVMILDGMRYEITQMVSRIDKIGCWWCDITKYDSNGIVEKLIGRRAVSEIDRRRRRLEQEGEVVLHHYSKEDMWDCDESVGRMLECHTERWPNAFKAPGFHAALIKRGVEAGIVDFSELRVGGKPVSWYIAMVWRDTYHLYMPAWETAYRNRGVGKLHLSMLVAEAAERGMARVDFMRGDEAYKMEWCDRTDYVFDCKIENHSLRSRIVNTLLRLRR